MDNFDHFERLNAFRAACREGRVADACALAPPAVRRAGGAYVAAAAEEDAADVYAGVFGAAAHLHGNALPAAAAQPNGAVALWIWGAVGADLPAGEALAALQAALRAGGLALAARISADRPGLAGRVRDPLRRAALEAELQALPI